MNGVDSSLAEGTFGKLRRTGCDDWSEVPHVDPERVLDCSARNLLIASRRWRFGGLVMASREAFSVIAVVVMVLSSLSLLPENRSGLDDDIVITTTDRDCYIARDMVSINVSVVGPIFASFSTACQCFFVVENSSGSVIYDLRSHTMWAEIPTSLHAPPTKIFEFAWDLTDDAGRQVQPGSYDIWGFVAGYNEDDEPVAGDSQHISVLERTFFDLELNEGRNFVSIPLVSHGYRASTLPLMKGDSVFRFNPVTQMYSMYINGVSQTDFPIMASEGYWIFASKAEKLHLQGYDPTGTTQTRAIAVPSSGGWATFGLASLDTTYNASDVPTWYTGQAIELVVAFESSTNEYKVYIKGVPPSDFSLVPGMAYWIYCTSSGTLSYPA
jgi:hypothetical protein